VYEGDELKGTYATRAEARRVQQQLESEQTAGSELQRHFITKDKLGRVVIWAGRFHAAQAARPVGVELAVRVVGHSELVGTLEVGRCLRAQRFTTFNDPNIRFVADSDSIPGGPATNPWTSIFPKRKNRAASTTFLGQSTMT
jgi:hypothetical protein